MNSLSWLIYLAGAIPNIGVSFLLFSVMVSLVILIFIVNYACWLDNNSGRHSSSGEVAVVRKKRNFWMMLLPVPLFLGLLIFGITPSRQTILMIAASESGEYLINTPQAQDTIKTLNNLLQSELNKLNTEVK